MELSSQIEALLFFKAEPVSVDRLAGWLKRTPEEIKTALAVLRRELGGRGIKLLVKEDEVALGTDPGAGGLIEQIAKEELTADLTKAALETLALVLYRGPLPKSEIDYLRGVNSTFTLRHLLVHGLIERLPNPQDKRGFLYRPTFDLLAKLGIERLEELPEYGSLTEKINDHQRL